MMYIKCPSRTDYLDCGLALTVLISLCVRACACVCGGLFLRLLVVVVRFREVGRSVGCEVVCFGGEDECVSGTAVGCNDSEADGCAPAGCSWLNDVDFSACGDGFCTVGEDCDSCSEDCGTAAAAVSGNGICEGGDGENCLTTSDCAGRQSGKPSNRYCCGSSDGNPTGSVGCDDSRCGDCTMESVGGGECACGDGDATNDDCTCLNDGVVPATAEICDNGVDDNCDGAVDCADSQCSGAAACVCTPSAASEVDCGNGEDEDSDGLVDCLDADCTSPTEVCNDNVDNKCDGLVDCDDPDCATDSSCALGGSGDPCSSNADCSSERPMPP